MQAEVEWQALGFTDWDGLEIGDAEPAEPVEDHIVFSGPCFTRETAPKGIGRVSRYEWPTTPLEEFLREEELSRRWSERRCEYAIKHPEALEYLISGNGL